MFGMCRKYLCKNHWIMWCRPRDVMNFKGVVSNIFKYLFFLNIYIVLNYIISPPPMSWAIFCVLCIFTCPAAFCQYIGLYDTFEKHRQTLLGHVLCTEHCFWCWRLQMKMLYLLLVSVRICKLKFGHRAALDEISNSTYLVDGFLLGYFPLPKTPARALTGP